jgi:hypothetical protein
MSKEFEKLLRKGEPWWKRLGRWWSGLFTRRVRVDSRSATDLLARVRHLQQATAGWSEILAALNPGNDTVAADLLMRLRGPHQFAPHVALNALEDACERVIAANPGASGIDALQEAVRRTDSVTR